MVQSLEQIVDPEATRYLSALSMVNKLSPFEAAGRFHPY